jgi:hypothetical protein
LDESEVNRRRREIRRLLLAEQDMRLTAQAAVALRKRPDRLLETALVVVYCRPFSGAPKEGREPQTVVDELAPKGDALNLHEQLFLVRNKLYAHTDDEFEHRREGVDVFGDHRYSEQYAELNRDLLEPIESHALALAEEFKEARERRQDELRAAGVPPDVLV